MYHASFKPGGVPIYKPILGFCRESGKVKKIPILSAGRGKTAQKSPGQGRNCIHLKDYAGG